MGILKRFYHWPHSRKPYVLHFIIRHGKIKLVCSFSCSAFTRNYENPNQYYGAAQDGQLVECRYVAETTVSNGQWFISVWFSNREALRKISFSVSNKMVLSVLLPRILILK